MLESRIDGLAVPDDPLLQVHERRDATAPGPADPPVQGFFTGLTLQNEHQAQALLQQIRPIQPGVGLGDPLQLGALPRSGSPGSSTARTGCSSTPGPGRYPAAAVHPPWAAPAGAQARPGRWPGPCSTLPDGPRPGPR